MDAEPRSRARLLAGGMTDRELRALRRRGVLVPVRPGSYLDADAARGEPAQRHRAAVRAAVARLREGTVISHASAAVLHGLPLWFPPGHRWSVAQVQATRDRRSGARLSAYVHLYAAGLEPEDVVSVDGMAVTGVARTLVDLARTAPYETALIAADAALHRHLLTSEELGSAARRGVRRRGNAAALRVAEFADAGAESPGESRSRLAIHRAGLPPPELQHEVRDGGRRWRVDFWWEGTRTIGEFDGRNKYGRLLAPGQDPGDVVYAEKLREDALRALDHRLLRWTWSDLDDFGPVAARLRRALNR